MSEENEVVDEVVENTGEQVSDTPEKKASRKKPVRKDTVDPEKEEKASGEEAQS